MVKKCTNYMMMLFVMALSCTTFAQTPKPNFIFIVVDDLNDGIEALNALPETLTPNINRICENGTVFTNAVCPAPLCCPSRTSFLTGKDAAYTQIYSTYNYKCTDFSQNFSGENNNATYFTLPGYLKDSAGYFTYGLNKIFHCYENYQEYDSLTADACNKKLSWNKIFVYNDSIILKPGINIEEQGVRNNPWSKINDTLEPYMMDYVAVDSSIQFIKNFAAGEGTCGNPFFLALGIKKPHEPLYIPSKYFDSVYVEDFTTPFKVPFNFPFNAYPPNGIILPPQPEMVFEDFTSLPENGMAQEMVKGADEKFELWVEGLDEVPEINANSNTMLNEDLLAWTKRANSVMAYQAGIKYIDTQIGRLLDSLSAYPEVYNNTIIILVGDNGYSLGQKKHWGKRAMWETDVRVPLIIADLRNPLPNTTNVTVNLLDIFPTVCALAEINTPEFETGLPYLDGKSLTTVMQAPQTQLELPQLSAVKKEFESEGFCYPQYAVRNERFHYIRYQSNGGGMLNCDSASSYFEEELYEIGENRMVDPYEWHNLINNAAYYPAAQFLQQWLPGNTMYLKQGYKVNIVSETQTCIANKNDTLLLNINVFDLDGTLSPEIPDMLYVWTNNFTADTLIGKEVHFPLALVPEKNYNNGDPLNIYFSLITNGTKITMGFDLQVFSINPEKTPEISYDLVSNDKGESFVSNFSIQPSANYWWWEINGDSLFYNTLPGPVNAGSNNTVTYKCIANYGNNNCEVVEEKMVVTKPLTYYDEHQLICLPNPANNEVILMHTENIIYGNLSIYDISGAIVKEIIISDAFSSFYKISISDLSAGLYVIALMDNNEVLTTSLIVTH